MVFTQSRLQQNEPTWSLLQMSDFEALCGWARRIELVLVRQRSQ